MLHRQFLRYQACFILKLNEVKAVCELAGIEVHHVFAGGDADLPLLDALAKQIYHLQLEQPTYL